MDKQRISRLTENQKKTILKGLNPDTHRGNIIWTLDYIYRDYFDSNDIKGFIDGKERFLYDPLCVANVIAFANLLKNFKWARYHYCLYDPDSDRGVNADLFDETGRFFDMYRDVYNIPYMLVERMRSNGLTEDNKYWISVPDFHAEIWKAINDYRKEVENSLKEESNETI